jgi:diguanylate cyclase (GGDEF)-like protein/PAS domain S-box-containing protein
MQEKSLTEAQRLAHIGSWEWDLSSGAQGWSQEALHILGYAAPQSVPTLEHLLARVHPEDRAELDACIHSAIRQRGSFDCEHRVLWPDGSERAVHHRGEVVEDGGLRVVAMLHDISEQQQLKEKLEQLAFHDPLTGLLNRARLADEIDSALDEWQRGGKAFALLFIDLDGFKQVNDRLGHKAGDRILTDVGRRLEGAMRAGDLVARYGGDEFLILARSVHRRDEAERLAGRLLACLAGTSAVGGGAAMTVTASIGIVLPDARMETSDELLHHVDGALYDAKREGKNRYAFYAPVPAAGPVSHITR